MSSCAVYDTGQDQDCKFQVSKRSGLNICHIVRPVGSRKWRECNRAAWEAKSSRLLHLLGSGAVS